MVRVVEVPPVFWKLSKGNTQPLTLSVIHGRGPCRFFRYILSKRRRAAVKLQTGQVRSQLREVSARAGPGGFQAGAGIARPTRVILNLNSEERRKKMVKIIQYFVLCILNLASDLPLLKTQCILKFCTPNFHAARWGKKALFFYFNFYSRLWLHETCSHVLTYPMTR